MNKVFDAKVVRDYMKRTEIGSGGGKRVLFSCPMCSYSLTLRSSSGTELRTINNKVNIFDKEVGIRPIHKLDQFIIGEFEKELDELSGEVDTKRIARMFGVSVAYVEKVIETNGGYS